MPGVLYLVATPIGNLEDITLRALRVLREAAVIAAEDTRRTAGLLAHYQVETSMVSLHEHNERDRVPQLLARLRAGDAVALVSDAGTPLVSDPGAALVTAARAAGVRVESIPGASAVLAALVSSGLAGDAFTFLGFPPAKASARRAWLRALAAEPRVVVFFEAPHRIVATLEALAEVCGDREAAVGRELTKRHEEILTGRIRDLLGRIGDPRGEYTVVVSPGADAAPPEPMDDDEAWASFLDLTARGGLGRRDAVAALARRYGVPAREVYAALERGKRAATTPAARPPGGP